MKKIFVLLLALTLISGTAMAHGGGGGRGGPYDHLSVGIEFDAHEVRDMPDETGFRLYASFGEGFLDDMIEVYAKVEFQLPTLESGTGMNARGVAIIPEVQVRIDRTTVWLNMPFGHIGAANRLRNDDANNFEI